VDDCEVLRIHYALTCHEWYKRFMANRDKAKAIYDERFCRMWEFYLAAVEMTFRHGSAMVFQLQLSHKRDAVPLVRDYITDSDRHPQ
jgi:cyclopropane-fatty-acyl-phospholipid synthase